LATISQEIKEGEAERKLVLTSSPKMWKKGKKGFMCWRSRKLPAHEGYIYRRVIRKNLFSSTELGGGTEERLIGC